MQEVENLNKPISIKQIEFVIFNLPANKLQAMWLHQSILPNIIPILHEFPQNMEEDRTFPTHFMWQA